PTSSDWHMWLRIALHGDVGYVARPVARYRQHAATISRRTRPHARLACDERVVRSALSAAGDLRDRGATTRARAALASRAVLQARDGALRGRRADALRMTLRAARLTRHAASPRLFAAVASGDQYRAHQCMREIVSG